MKENNNWCPKCGRYLHTIYLGNGKRKICYWCNYKTELKKYAKGKSRRYN